MNETSEQVMEERKRRFHNVTLIIIESRSSREREHRQACHGHHPINLILMVPRPICLASCQTNALPTTPTAHHRPPPPHTSLCELTAQQPHAHHTKRLTKTVAEERVYGTESD